MNQSDTIKKLSIRLDDTADALKVLDTYWQGTQPAAFLSPDSAKALGTRMRALAVNFPRLAVQSLSERLTPVGFRVDGANQADPELWKLWKRNSMEDAATQAHTDALVYGRSFAVVWASAPGKPVISIESPRHMAVHRDPVTREVVAALKRWTAEGRAHAVLYLPGTIVKLTHQQRTDDAALLPAVGWETSETIPNPLGVVPVVPIVNRGRLSEIDGVSEMEDVLGLADALNKLMADAMVTSEHYARPRRWAVGLEISEDADGNPVNPFSNEANKLWQAEDEGVKFGQFDAARLDGYADLTAVVTQQIGALSGLPPHYLGLHGDQPTSADAIRSAEASLVSRAFQLQRTFGNAWAAVMGLAVAVRDGVDPEAVEIDTVWANPETRTPAQAADAALKLKQIGVPLGTILADTLGMTPRQVQTITGETATTDSTTNQEN